MAATLGARWWWLERAQRYAILDRADFARPRMATIEPELRIQKPPKALI